MTINLTINNKIIQAQENQTVLEAAHDNGIVIPTLCYHKDLSPVGSCRLCVVEVDKWRGQVSACNLPVKNGMVVRTETEPLQQSRRSVLSLLLRNYQDSGQANHDGIESEFEYWLRYYRISLPEGESLPPRYIVDNDPNPFIRVDFNKCILCTRCVRACAEIQGRFVWGVGGRGSNTRIIAGAETTMLEARCESCGACAVYCPTGALDHKLSFQEGKPDRKVTTTCAFCGVGCQFDLNVKDGKVIKVSSNPNAPVNKMHLCVKGRYGYDFIHHRDRLTHPKVRRYLLKGDDKVLSGSSWDWVETDWNTALDITAKKLSFTRDQYGSTSIGVLTSAKCLNEETYLMNKLARQVLGTNNIDHCARLCHSSTVVGLTTSFGSGAMSNSMDDIAEKSAAIFVIGSNTTEQHPVFGSMLRQAVIKRGAKLVVADPRRVDIVDFAKSALGGIYLRNRPGTDIVLLNGMMNIILKNGWEDKGFIAGRTEGFDEFAATIENYPPDKVSEITGVPVEQLYRATEILALNKPMSVIWAMGITQHIVGVSNVMNLANLQMLLGNMGIEGGGVNPLRGQNNVQGACDMGGLPNVYPGYQSVTSNEARKKFEEAWGVSLPDKVGLTTTEMVSGTENGEIRSLYILGEDPVMSDPNTGHIRHCLERCEFLVLEEIFPSETSVYADVLLPGVSFAEKTGTFTNTERRVQMCHQAISPLGEARPDWQITAEIAKRLIALRKQNIRPTPFSKWEYNDTSEIMSEIAAVTPSYAGVSFARLEAGERLQWPVKGLNHPGTPVLHIGQFTRGRGLFAPINHIPPAELPDEEFPVLLSTGRVLYHWHGGQMTRRAKGLMGVYNRALVEINPEDAAQWNVKDGGRLRVTSRRGSIEANAWITDRVPSGMVYANFHFPAASANELTHDSMDPVAKIPEYKISAVRVEMVKDVAQ
jgi:formate dehydrogenase, alpha subunit, archaeal-type